MFELKICEGEEEKNICYFVEVLFFMLGRFSFYFYLVNKFFGMVVRCFYEVF